MPSENELTYVVWPRYTASGAPEFADEEQAIACALAEHVAYTRSTTGANGPAAAVRARSLGVGGVVIMARWRRARGGWEVEDLITRDVWFWPKFGDCPECKARVVTTRGAVYAHPRGDALCVGTDRFVGRLVKGSN